MTQDEIIGMAREAGMEVHPRKGSIRICSAIFTGCDSTAEVTRFAALVAAKAAADEREACAVIADENDDGMPYNAGEAIAAAVRARGGNV